MNNLEPGLKELFNAMTILRDNGWLLTQCIWGGITATHGGRGIRREGRTAEELITMAAQETTTTDLNGEQPR